MVLELFLSHSKLQDFLIKNVNPYLEPSLKTQYLLLYPCTCNTQHHYVAIWIQASSMSLGTFWTLSTTSNITWVVKFDRTINFVVNKTIQFNKMAIIHNGNTYTYTHICEIYSSGWYIPFIAAKHYIIHTLYILSCQHVFINQIVFDCKK